MTLLNRVNFPLKVHISCHKLSYDLYQARNLTFCWMAPCATHFSHGCSPQISLPSANQLQQRERKPTVSIQPWGKLALLEKRKPKWRLAVFFQSCHVIFIRLPFTSLALPCGQDSKERKVASVSKTAWGLDDLNQHEFSTDPACFDVGIDYRGIPLVIIPNVNSSTACQSRCQRNTSCALFSYTTEDFPDYPHHCALTTAIREWRINPTVVSGPKYC